MGKVKKIVFEIKETTNVYQFPMGKVKVLFLIRRKNYEKVSNPYRKGKVKNKKNPRKGMSNSINSLWER